MTIPVDDLQLLVDLALKSIIIMLGALSVHRILSRAPAAVRHLTWTLALCGLLALPALTLILPEWRAPLLPTLGSSESIEGFKPVSGVKADERLIASLSVDPPASLDPPAGSTAVSAVDEQTAAWEIDWTQLALIVWLTGALIVLVRLAAGMFRVRRIVRRSQFVIDYPWGAMVRKLAGQLHIPDHVALLRSQYVGMPLTWGIWNPVILFPEEADQWSAEWRRIVLLHELAHIKRRDCLTQLLAQVVCAIYWFNPLVWLAARRLRVEREIACDDHVLQAGTRASDYARYLLDLAGVMNANGSPAGLPSPAAAGIACSQLESRVRSILDPAIKRKSLSRRARSIIFAIALCLLIPLATLQPWSGAASPIDDPADQSLAPLQEPQSDSSPPAQPNKNRLGKGSATAAQAPSLADPDINTDVELSEEEDQEDNDGQSTQETNPSKGDRASSGMTVDTIIKMKMHGVTPEFVESMRRAGFGNLSVEELVKLRMHGIGEGYIKETQKASNEKLSIEDLIQLKIFGVTPEYAKEMKSAGYDLPLKSLKKMRMFGITPGYIETIRKLGYTNLTAEQLTKLKMHGVSEGYLKEMRDAGFSNLNVEEITRMRMFGVDPAYIKEMRDAGYDKLSMEQLTKMRMHGVTPAYIKEMRNAGFDKLTTEELVKLRMFGVTADYVNKMRAAGLKNISLNDLIKMKMHGIDKILLKSEK
jgi:beta-lactamase regulating signal transducer with metallopeptidase domain/predicted metallopeptidase